MLTIALVTLLIGQIKGAEIYIALIKGFMVGFLYHKEQYDDGFNEYTLQCLIGVVNLTVKWEREQSG